MATISFMASMAAAGVSAIAAIVGAHPEPGTGFAVASFSATAAKTFQISAPLIPGTKSAAAVTLCRRC